MSNLYVANATRQTFEFTYRLPEVKGAKAQTIPIGGQVNIGSGQLRSADIDAILEHYRSYGLVSVTEAEKRTVPFSGLIYSTDKPVPIDRLQKTMTRRVDDLVDLGKKIRQEAAVAVNNAIESEMEEQRFESRLTNLEMTVQEEESKVGDRTGPRISEGVRVVRDEQASNKPKRANKR